MCSNLLTQRIEQISPKATFEGRYLPTCPSDVRIHVERFPEVVNGFRLRASPNIKENTYIRLSRKRQRRHHLWPTESSGAKPLKNHRCELIFFACIHQFRLEHLFPEYPHILLFQAEYDLTRYDPFLLRIFKVQIGVKRKTRRVLEDMSGDRSTFDGVDHGAWQFQFMRQLRLLPS